MAVIKFDGAGKGKGKGKTTSPVAKPMPQQKAGPGKKLCPNCGFAIGTRTLVCSCGHRFPAPKVKPVYISKKDAVLPSQAGLKEALETVAKARAVVDEVGGTDKAAEIVDQFLKLSGAIGGGANKTVGQTAVDLAEALKALGK
jgi:hypothetical protein